MQGQYFGAALFVFNTIYCMPLPSTTNEKSIIDQLLRRSKLTSTAVKIINRLLQRTIVETISVDQALTLEDSGKFFLLDSADESAEVLITLPELSTNLIGTVYTFAVVDPSDGRFKIQVGDRTNDTGDQFLGYAFHGADQASDAVSGAINGRITVPANNNQCIVLDANAGNGGGEGGTTVKLTAISTTQWYCEAIIFTDDTNSSGAGIFQNAS